LLAKTKGIVLHTIDYGETSVIAAIYTENSGRQSFIVNSARSQKAKNKAGLLQPLYILELEIYQRPSSEIHRVKELRLAQPYHSLPFQISKSAQTLFLAEILFKTLREEESYPQLFGFIENMISYFDLMPKGFGSFHLYFLARLTEYLGFFPNLSGPVKNGYFDLKNGCLSETEPRHPYFADKNISGHLSRLFNLQVNELENFKPDGKTKSLILENLLTYYQIHFGNMGKINSLAVLKEIFE